jgi:PPOX class probable F420-dependent enzyme
MSSTIDQLAHRRHMQLETRRRDGSWVPTIVNPVVEDDHVYFRTWDTSGKAKRLRNFSEVKVTPASAGGRADGPEAEGRARLLEGAAAAHAASLLNRRYPFLQGTAVRLYHRLRGLHTQHYEISGLHG